jgi:outer membrane protein OmpA-like peptidoglycan-associated protein
MLDDLELSLVQQLDATEHQERAQHAVPALEGDFLQALGRRGASFTLAGFLANGDGTVAEQLKGLREKFRSAAPVDFVADIATATRVASVLIEEMSVRELAGKTQRFEYAFTLREYIPAPATEEETPPPTTPPLETSLIVEVRVQGQPGYDFSQVQVSVKGTQEDGVSIDRPLTNRSNNVWTEETFSPGSYKVRATAPDPVLPNTIMVKEAQAEILEGEKEHVIITLVPGQRRNVAIAYVIHYWFDKGFIEPCLRPVLREVAQYAANHDTEKLLIVGHTDKVGSDAYNQALSERRARGVYAYLTFKDDENAAVAEWNELRKTRTVGDTNSLNDTWSVREYQYMLQDLGFYVGPINEIHDDNTDAAVRAYQHSKGLTEDGIVGDNTWPVLIRDYLAKDPLSVDESCFFKNASDDCDGGPLLWLGCSESDPLKNEDIAWRPNRRTEMLFAYADEIPCELPRPVTWDIRPDDSTVPPWCLGPGNKNKPCCFISREAEAPDKWLVEPAHLEKVQISGKITFENGTPYANQRYALIAPDGKFLHKKIEPDGTEKADSGEVASGNDRGRPIYMRTDTDGNFSHLEDTPIGIYILELPDLAAPQVARVDGSPPSSARGNTICLEFLPDKTQQNIIIQPGTVPPTPIQPSISLAQNFVMVKKPHTNPPRVQVTLGADFAFSGTGTIDRSGNIPAVRLFTAASGGTEITFDGTDNVFPGANLAAGVQLFAEAGPAPSGAVDDFTLTLTLNPSGIANPAGPPATASLTAVLFTLDIALSRPAPGTAPPIMSEADKINVGRHVQLRDATFNHERAMLIVRRPTPALPVTLELLPQNGRVQAFTAEAPAAGQTPVVAPLILAPGSIPAAGSQFFIEGATVSTAVRDTGYLLRVQGMTEEVDRVKITVCAATLTNNVAPFNTTIPRVQIEGILNRELNPNGGTFSLSDLFGNQANSLFRVRVDIPGIAGNTLNAVLISNLANGTQIERRDVKLTRSSGNRFVSLPTLAIPDPIPRNEITFAAVQDIEVIRARAGGQLRLEFNTGTGISTQQVRVRGRVLQMCSITIQGAAPNINGNMTTANRVMAQCGIEFRMTNLPSVNNLALLDIQRTTCPLTVGGDNNRRGEERTLFALGRNDCAVNYIVYFIRSDSMGLNGCSAYPVGRPGITVSDIASQYTFAHENGHVLHLPHDGRANNLMTGAGTGTLPGNPARVHLLPDQCKLMNESGFLTFVE